MLARITYGLVGLALITLIAGFFQKSSNALLYVSIVLSVIAIVLVLVGAARRARETPAVEEAFEAPMEPALDETQASVFTEDEEGADLFADEEEAEEVEEVLPRRRAPASSRSTGTKSATKAAPKPRTRAAAPARAASTRAGRAAPRSTGKVVVVPGRDRYHTSSCRFIQGKSDLEEVTAATAKRRGYEPCSACKPAS